MHRALALIRGDFEPRTWAAFWRSAVEGATAAEVSSELNLSIDAVYQAKSRVLRRLREELQGLVD
jgi:RNA polymerase sigma-70 factor (ECF subfamily)